MHYAYHATGNTCVRAAAHVHSINKTVYPVPDAKHDTKRIEW